MRWIPLKNYSKYINPYMEMILYNKVEHCVEQEDMIRNIVLPVLDREDVFIDEERIENGLELQKYFPYRLLEWEIFLFALIVGVRFKNSDDIYFTDIRIIVGRGAGKNGFISFLCFYFLSPAHGIPHYDIDILANSEKQAKRSFNDVYEIITSPVSKKYERRLKSNYYVTKELIQGRVTKSTLEFNTSSKHGKDSKRTGCVIFDEKHEYSDFENINTLQSGLGKTKDGRVITITTDGHNRGGVLDQEKEQNHLILEKYNPENQTLVFWCKIEKEEEWKDIDKMVKANPSINDMPHLKRTIKKEIADMPFKPEYFQEYMAKRCNYPIGNRDIEVASWEDIKATNQPIPDLDGQECVGGIDYSSTDDFTVCGLLFKYENKYYWKQHTFVCTKSKDLLGIQKRTPIDQWARDGDVTYIDDVEIKAEYVAQWFEQQQKKHKYKIRKIGMDKYKYTYMNHALSEIGFEAYTKKNVYPVRPSNIQENFTIINSMFINHNVVFGDVPIMRWYTNNAKKVVKGLNFEYGKQEEHYRKTDGFMAFVAAVVVKDAIKEKKKRPNMKTIVINM